MVLKKCLPAVLIILFSTTAARSQLKYDFPQFFDETGHYFTAPLHWDQGDVLAVGGLAAGTAVSAVLESPERSIKFVSRSLYNSFPVQFGNMYGGFWGPAILFAGYGGYSLITGDMTARKIGYEIGQSLIYAGVIVTAVKIAAGRARPYAGDGKASFVPFSLFDDSHHSFPSGHVTVAFCLSTVLALNAEPLWLKILAFAPAAFTPFARVYQGNHWISDCVFGAGIGFFTAKWCVDTHGRTDDGKKANIEVNSLWPFSFSVALD